MEIKDGGTGTTATITIFVSGKFHTCTKLNLHPRTNSVLVWGDRSIITFVHTGLQNVNHCVESFAIFFYYYFPLISTLNQWRTAFVDAYHIIMYEYLQSEELFSFMILAMQAGTRYAISWLLSVQTFHITKMVLIHNMARGLWTPGHQTHMSFLNIYF